MNETAVTRAGGKAASRRAGAREKIVRATADLVAEGGREAASTRAVAAAAGVQATAIYRLFGDMRGLLDEVVSFGYSEYLRGKVAREVVEDPVEDLRRGWDLHVEFGLANPALITLMYGDPRPDAQPAAAREGVRILRGLVQRIAEAGRLRVGVDRATGMIHAAGTGVVLSLIAEEPEDRDPALSGATREAVLAAVTTDGPEADAEEESGRDHAASRAVALRAGLPELEADLTFGERAILSELLDRIADPAR